MKNEKNNIRGLLMVLAAALLWSSNAPFVRWITLDAVTVAGIRSAIAALVLLPFLSAMVVTNDVALLIFVVMSSFEVTDPYCWLMFIYTYIFQLGFLDGKEGFIYHNAADKGNVKRRFLFYVFLKGACRFKIILIGFNHSAV